MAEPEDGKKREHDITAIKRSTAEALRYGAATGRKVMLVWDKACIDYRHWSRLKHTYGIYFTTCEKSNSAAEIIAVNLLNHSEPRNQGVVSDHIVGTSNGVQLRRIVYINPEDGVTYTYLTNDFTLPAYQIVLLLFEKHIEATEGLRDEVEEKKQAGRIKPISGIIVQAVRNFINSALTRATQRTQRFIRWVRVRLLPRGSLE